MKVFALSHIALAGSWLLLASAGVAQHARGDGSLQDTLNQSAETGTFTVVVFHRERVEANQAFHQQAQAALTPHAEKTVLATARIDDPAEKALIEKLGIGRAPMPMAVVIAPNGAVTGLFPRTITSEQIASALVPPTMMACMKELQNKKLVFVCLTRTDRVEVPQGVADVQHLEQFKDRIAVVGMRLDDPAEARFYEQMKLSPSDVDGPYAVLIAPPGAMIGHFDARATADQIAAAIHKAGKCCEDENCKHNHASRAPAAGGSRQ